jgi:hypothetical protein
VAEATEEQEGVGLAVTRLEGVGGGVDAGAEVVVETSLEPGEEGFEVLAVIAAADLDAVELGEELKFVTQGAEILKRGLGVVEDSAAGGHGAGDGLEVDVVFEEGAGEVAETAGVLAKDEVFELEDVDVVVVEGAVDGPLDVVGAEFVNGVGFEGAGRGVTANLADLEL